MALAGLLKTAVGMVGALWLALAGWAGAEWWEHRPAGQPQLRLWLLRWSPPDSLAAQRDKARGALGACYANVAALKGGLARQNAAVEGLAAEGRRRLAHAEAALERQRAGTALARTAAEGLLATPPAGEGVCQRMEDADRRVLESLR